MPSSPSSRLPPLTTRSGILCPSLLRRPNALCPCSFSSFCLQAGIMPTQPRTQARAFAGHLVRAILANHIPYHTVACTFPMSHSCQHRPSQTHMAPSPDGQNGPGDEVDLIATHAPSAVAAAAPHRAVVAYRWEANQQGRIEAEPLSCCGKSEC